MQTWRGASPSWNLRAERYHALWDRRVRSLIPPAQVPERRTRTQSNLNEDRNFRTTSDSRQGLLTWDASIADGAASCWTGHTGTWKARQIPLPALGFRLPLGTKARAMMNSQDVAPARFATRTRCRPFRFDAGGMRSVISSDAKKGVEMFKKTTLDAKDKGSAVLPP